MGFFQCHHFALFKSSLQLLAADKSKRFKMSSDAKGLSGHNNTLEYTIAIYHQSK
jgi:hypothetical protein